MLLEEQEYTMKTDKAKREKRLNLIGMSCGMFLVLLLVINIASGLVARAASANARTLTASAPGKVGDVTVQVKADDKKIYEVIVTEHSETEGIGTMATDALPGQIVEKQSLALDAVSGATVTSEAIKQAVALTLQSGGLSPEAYVYTIPETPVKPVAHKVETGTGVQLLHAADWKEQYPDQYNSWLMTSESDEIEDYLEVYPMLRGLYEGYGFAIDYGSARGHYYDVQDIEATGRPHPLANCWTCKTPDFTNMVNEMGVEAYKLEWTEVQKQIVDPISCYTCHANTPGEITVTHTYWIDALGEDFETVDAANLACGQCHNEYYFAPDTKATSIAHNSIASMAPDQMLAFFNDGSNFSTGEPFADWTNPRTGVKQIKVQHPEFETFLGEGSQHRATYTCADCHMPTETKDNGMTYRSHNLISPLDNPELIENECSKCHVDLVSEVHETQARIEARTYSIGYELEYLTELLAAAVEKGEMPESKLDEVRAIARDAQFYWDFVFVENAEGAHNPTLTDFCLDKAEELTNQAVNLMRGAS